MKEISQLKEFCHSMDGWATDHLSTAEKCLTWIQPTITQNCFSQ